MDVTNVDYVTCGINRKNVDYLTHETNMSSVDYPRNETNPLGVATQYVRSRRPVWAI